MQYTIFEGNMERLEKKLLRIYNKCKAYGCEFHYEVVGETFKELKDKNGNSYTARFLIIEAEGTAVINDWEFVASVEHTEKGNLFNKKSNVEIPERYYAGKPVCEHCNANRVRKYTYIIRNTKTGEFKQVGKSCLKDFTHGMSVEAIAQYISMFDALIEGEAPYPGSHIESYVDKERYLKFVAETIRYFGYVKSSENARTTAIRALDYYNASRGRCFSGAYLKALEDEMAGVGFNIDSAQTVQKVKDALEWVAGQEDSNNYMHNLKTACSLEYVAYKNCGLLASLFQAFDRDVKRVGKWKEEHKEGLGSSYIGKVGDKVTVKVRSVRCVTSYETVYGTKRIYKFIDTDGNVLIWKTGLVINNESEITSVTGTVKAHDEFRGCRQTELTRCKATI